MCKINPFETIPGTINDTYLNCMTSTWLVLNMSKIDSCLYTAEEQGGESVLSSVLQVTQVVTVFGGTL